MKQQNQLLESFLNVKLNPIVSTFKCVNGKYITESVDLDDLELLKIFNGE